MSKVQLGNTLRDLLRLDDVDDVVDGLTGDALVGFDHDTEALYVGEELRAGLEVAAETLAERVTSDAAALQRIAPQTGSTLTDQGTNFIVEFGRRAHRAPLTQQQHDGYLDLFLSGAELYPDLDPYVASVRITLQAFLQSPHFLYRTELGTEAVDGVIALNSYEVASKLSYALTDTMPDDDLFAAADANSLQDPVIVSESASRLLRSERGALGRDHFHLQVYRLGAYDGISRDRTVFPEFTDATPSAMRAEVLQFLRGVFDRGGGIADVFTSTTTYVNQALAPLYGLTGTFDDTFVERQLDPTQRAGLLTQPGFLSQYALANDPDSIHRGVFVNQRILCVQLPPPDPNATQLIEPTPDMTNRERVEATTGDGTCGQGCHSAVINPAGFAFENYDAIGKYRTEEKGKAIDASGTYQFKDGPKSFQNAVEFSAMIAESPQAHECYTRSWASYLYARSLTEQDTPLMAYLGQLSVQGDLSIEELVMTIVSDASFVQRRP